METAPASDALATSAPANLQTQPVPLRVGQGPPALLTPTARKVRKFPRWAAIALGIGWLLGVFAHWIDWTLLDIAYALGLVGSLVSSIVISSWAEDRLYTAPGSPSKTRTGRRCWRTGCRRTPTPSWTARRSWLSAGR